jgi:tight adherence protein B
MPPRVVGAAAAVTVGLVVAAGAAGAAPGAPVNITGIEVKNGSIIGLVSSSGGATIDPSLKLTVAGKDYPVDAITSGQGSPVARTAMIVVDTSGSMGEAGMTTVRSGVASFLKSVPDDVRLGVVSFSGRAALNLKPTTDHGKVQAAVNALKSKGETALYDAVTLAVQALGTTGERSILLLSDGGDTASTKATKATATAALKSGGVRAEAVAFKSSESDASVLKGFAAAGGGSVVSAANAGAVQSAFTSAAKTLASQLTFSLPLPVGVSAVQNVKVSGTAGGVAFASTALVDVGAGIAPAASSKVDKNSPIVGPTDDVVKAQPVAAKVPVLGVSRNVALGLGGVFVGLLALGIAFGSGSFKSGRTTRVENIERYVTTGAAAVKSKTRPSAVSENLVFLGERMMEGRSSTSKTMGRIEKADLPLRAGEWWVLRIVALVVGVAASMLLIRGGLLMTVLAAVLGFVFGIFAPAFVLRFLANRRGKKFDHQLPDVLTLVASSLSTGFSLPQALDAVAKDSADPSAKEFSRALAETRIGADIADSLERMASRMDSDNMRWTSMAIRIQREVGGNLAETLRTTAKTLREREELGRHVRALSAEGRLSAYILIGLPIGIFFYTMQTNRDYIELLWTRPLGLAMIGAGLVSLTLGVFWMRKVVDVKV